jgi:NAD(P)-dependent dehydrogenase (short-subunit alcohol dehydrogenase family)
VTRFVDRSVIVFGGGSGIGRAVALGFAGEGARVTVVGRRAEALAETVRQAGEGHAVVADVTHEDDVARAVREATERHGGLDVAFNGAGIIGSVAPTAELDEPTWSAVLSTNLTGVWLAMKHEIAVMREHGGGAIVNVASNVGAHIRRPGFGAYVAAKAGVSALTRTAAQEYIGDGIRINAVSPGPFDTTMSFRAGESEADRAERLKTALPIGRVGALDEITATVLWLASAEAGFVVGHDLVIDGGASA